LRYKVPRAALSRSSEFEDYFAEVAAICETLKGFAPPRDRECSMYCSPNCLLFHYSNQRFETVAISSHVHSDCGGMSNGVEDIKACIRVASVANHVHRATMPRCGNRISE
jgi:hypothetical protein